ncbi:hypothetical protein CARUB_v10001521mg [Capsella rubella]|uniref:Uncharacterized protein n=1 Tax=Capsella rubella TaxID=81985 RepID=R0HBV5_9BRAS|nr:uncharacterized protein LOC17881778 [Capsella rubella]EOA21173.1 hypothetical protein CARUB_v10001521mg [Capsella rubella]
MGSTINTNLRLIVIVFCVVISNLLHSMVHCGNNNIDDLDDLIRSYAARDTTTRRQTGSLYAISLPSNLSDIKASVVTVRNSMFWRKGTNFSGVLIPPMVKTTPYAKRIAFVYESFGDHSSSVYFRLTDNHSFVSPVIGFTGYDATNTNDLKKLNLSIKRDDPIVIKFDPYASRDRRRIRCIAFGDNGLFSSFSNTIRDHECATTNSHGHYALVTLKLKTKAKHEPELVRRNWWWFVLTGIGVSVIAVAMIVVVVKLVKKKRLRKMERESEKSETIGNVWIGRSRMPAATMVRTQPCLEYHEDLPSSSNIP